MTPDPLTHGRPRTEVGLQVLNFFRKMRQQGELPDKTKWKAMVESVDRIDGGLKQLDSIQFELGRLSAIVEVMERRLIAAENQIAYLINHIL